MSPHSPVRRRRLVALTAAAALAGAMLATQAGPAQAAPSKIRSLNANNAIANSYIVVYKDSVVAKNKVDSVTDRLASKHKASVGFRYSSALRGFSATMSKAEAERLASDTSVAFVEQDRTISIAATQSPTPSWGLDRIDQRDLPLNNSYTYANTGAGVTAYVIDTGIRISHSAFGGRAVWGFNAVDANNTDCNGHGTHVAGTVGGTAYGVAKGVRLVAVKVLNCSGSGSYSGVVAGINWVTSNHVTGPSVANMSLGGPADSATESAVRASIADGVTYAVASGNANASACNYTPARVAEAITVNATTQTDARASYSNYGGCTDIFAPGSNITSAWSTNDTATNTINGTSMASPHVAGVAALILGAAPSSTPAQVWNTMSAGATLNKVTNPGTNSPNRLLYRSPGTTPPPTGCGPQTNGNDISISDNATVNSNIAVSGCAGNASATATIEVHIVHTYRGDLVVDLLTPTGAVINLSNRAGGSADNIDQVFTRNLSAYAANGTWTLRVRDAASGDVGYINSWTLDI